MRLNWNLDWNNPFVDGGMCLVVGGWKVVSSREEKCMQQVQETVEGLFTESREGRKQCKKNGQRLDECKI